MDRGAYRLRMAVKLLTDAYNELDAARRVCRDRDTEAINMRMAKVGAEIRAVGRLAEMERYLQ